MISWIPAPNLWQEITLTRLFLEPVTSPVTNRDINCGMLMDWLTQSTYKLFVVCCFVFAVNLMWLLFLSVVYLWIVCVSLLVLMILGSEACLVTYMDLFFTHFIGVILCFKCRLWHSQSVGHLCAYLYIYSSCILLQLRAYSSRYWFICRPFWQITNLRNRIHFGILLFENMFSYMFKQKTANCINFEPLKRSWGSILSVIEHAVFHLEIPPYTYCKCGVQSKCFNDSHLYMSCQT